MSEPDEEGLDEPDITIFVEDGEVFQVQYKGEITRARVIDYDVEFPMPAGNISQDEEGRYFLDIIV